jgi:hypothetical protein
LNRPDPKLSAIQTSTSTRSHNLHHAQEVSKQIPSVRDDESDPEWLPIQDGQGNGGDEDEVDDEMPIEDGVEDELMEELSQQANAPFPKVR